MEYDTPKSQSLNLIENDKGKKMKGQIQLFRHLKGLGVSLKTWYELEEALVMH